MDVILQCLMSLVPEIEVGPLKERCVEIWPRSVRLSFEDDVAFSVCIVLSWISSKSVRSATIRVQDFCSVPSLRNVLAENCNLKR